MGCCCSNDENNYKTRIRYPVNDNIIVYQYNKIDTCWNCKIHIHYHTYKYKEEYLCNECYNSFQFFDNEKTFIENIGKWSVINYIYITFFKLAYFQIIKIVKIDYFDINSTSSEIIKYVDFDYYYNNFFSFYNKYRKVCEFFYYDVNGTIHNARECWRFLL